MTTNSRAKIFLVIGAGNIGSRHVQALLKGSDESVVHVVDPSEDALQVTKMRAFEAIQDKNFERIKLYSSLESLNLDRIDLCVIATSSKHRLEALKQIVSRYGSLKIILEKFLFPSLSDYKQAEKYINKSQSKVWVNCPRRSFNGYQKLKGLISGPVKAEVSGQSWGLACNSIHFLDLIAFLTDEEISRIDTRLLDKNIIESKRNGYIEVMGTLTASFNKKSVVEIRCLPGSFEIPKISIKDCNGQSFHIDEDMDQIITSSNDVFSIGTELQSNLTDKAAEEIIETGESKLPTYKTSSLIHQQLLECLIKHAIEYEESTDTTGPNKDYLPIT